MPVMVHWLHTVMAAVWRLALCTRVGRIGIYTLCQISPISIHPTFFSGRKAIARRSSSAARPMRTAAARRGPMHPQLASCKREATEQTV